MQKDLKIGLAVGLGVVAVVGLWLATRPSLTPQARIQRLHNTHARKETNVKPRASAVSENPAPESASDAPGTNTPEYRSDAIYPVGQRETFTSQAPEAIPQGPTEVAPPQQDPPAEPVIPEQTELIKTEKFYIVQKNDTLSSISQKYYDTPTKWPKIFNANRTIISDANRLAIGAKLIIPDDND